MGTSKTPRPKRALNLKEDPKQDLLAVLQKISHFYWGPTLEQCEHMLQPSFWLPIEKVLFRLDSSSEVIFKEIKAVLNHFPTAPALFDGLEEEYVRLFISDRRGIRAPLYASCYGAINSAERAPLMGEPALAMQERFRSKGLSLADDIGEPPDHLSIELEYLYFLLERGWAEDGDLLLKEAGQFASEIMLPWVGQLRQRLEAIETENPFYPLITTLLSAFLKMIGEIKEGV